MADQTRVALDLLEVCELTKSSYLKLSNLTQEAAKQFVLENEREIRKNPKKFKFTGWIGSLPKEQAPVRIKEFPNLAPERIAPSLPSDAEKEEERDVSMFSEFFSDKPYAVEESKSFDPKVFIDESQEYDFGTFREGFDLDRYQRLLYSFVTETLEPNLNEQKKAFRLIQLWCVKLNLYGTRIKEDNYISSNGRMITAVDFISLLMLKRSKINTSFKDLTLSRVLRIYANISASYAEKKDLDLPLFLQCPVQGLPKNLHFLNAIYVHGASDVSDQLIELSANFDRLIRRQGVELQVRSYEARAISFLQTPSALESHRKVFSMRVTSSELKATEIRSDMRDATDETFLSLQEQLFRIEEEIIDHQERIRNMSGSNSKKKNTKSKNKKKTESDTEFE